MKNPQIQSFIDTIESLHSLTVLYSSFLKNTDVHKHFESEGVKLNSLYWLTAHIANCEDLLLGTALGKKGHEFEWLKKFDIGSTKDIKGEVAYPELVEIAKQIHIDCMHHLKSLTDEDLKKDNLIEFAIGKDKSYKAMIIHHIRHQGVHTGHLSTLCRLNRIKTF